MLYKILKTVGIIVASCLLLCESVAASIADTAYDTVTLSDITINNVWENLNLQVLTDTDLSNFLSPIVSFDVSTENNVVIGLKNCQILVIDNNGKLLYAYEKQTEGSYYVQWKGNNILLFLTRSSLIVEFSIDGQLVNMVERDTHSMNNTDLNNQLRRIKKITIGDSDYFLQNNMGFLNLLSFQTYSQLCKTDVNGNITVIYDVNSEQIANTLMLLIGLTVFVVSVILIVFRQVIKGKFRRK